jgi:hypothetical protein
LWQTIVEKLPGRTAGGSGFHARQLGLKTGKGDRRVVVAWTEAEDEEIRAGIAAGETSKAIAKKLPGRTVEAVVGRRKRLGKSGRWTAAEDAALREGFASGKGWKEIAEDYPGRTDKAVAARGGDRLKPHDSGSASEQPAS